MAAEMIPVATDAVTPVSKDRLSSMQRVSHDLIADFLLCADDSTAGHTDLTR
jgi:hypothetical protein